MVDAGVWAGPAGGLGAAGGAVGRWRGVVAWCLAVLFSIYTDNTDSTLMKV